MAVIENLDIVLGARTQKLDAGLDRSRQRVQAFESDMSRMSNAARAAFAPLQGLVMGIVGSVPGASAAIAAFSGIATALSAGATSKVAKELKTTATDTKQSAVEMGAFAVAATQAAVATTVISRNSNQLRLPAPRPRGMSVYNPMTAAAGAMAGIDDASDAEFTVLSKVAPQASTATAALGGMSVAGVAAGAAVAAAFVAVAAGAAGAVITIRQVRQQLTEIDDAGDAAKRLNMTFNDLLITRQALSRSSGLDTSAIDASMQKMQLNLRAAREGTGPLVDQLKSLGLDAGQLLASGPVAALQEISAAAQGMKDPIDQSKLAMDLFGKSGVGLVTIFREGPEAISEMEARMQAAGLTLSQAQVEQVGAANDAWEDMTQIATGAFRQLAAEFAPVITVVAESVQEVALAFRGWPVAIRPTIDSMIIMAALAKDTLEAVLALPIAQAKVASGDISGAAIAAAKGMDFGTARDWLGNVNKARREAEAAAKAGPGVPVDVDALEAEVALGEEAKRLAEEKDRIEKQRRESIGDTLQNMLDEVTALRDGNGELERQKLQDLQKLVEVGAIDIGTAERAAREAAQEAGGQQRETPTFGALQRGSVDAYSAAMKNDRAGSEQLQKQANQLLGQMNTWLEQLNTKIGNVQSIGNMG